MTMVSKTEYTDFLCILIGPIDAHLSFFYEMTKSHSCRKKKIWAAFFLVLLFSLFFWGIYEQVAVL